MSTENDALALQEILTQVEQATAAPDLRRP